MSPPPAPGKKFITCCLISDLRVILICPTTASVQCISDKFCGVANLSQVGFFLSWKMNKRRKTRRGRRKGTVGGGGGGRGEGEENTSNNYTEGHCSKHHGAEATIERLSMRHRNSQLP